MDTIIDESIVALCENFKQNPEYFKDEKNLTFNFYDIIMSRKFQGYKFRWEYLTNVLYKKHTPDNTGTPKKIDMCFIKDDFFNSIPYAMEFKLKLNMPGIKNEFSPSNFKVIDPDFDELQEIDNKINKGYIIFFTFAKISNNNRRKNAHIKNKGKFFDKYDELIGRIQPDKYIKIVFACVEHIDGINRYSVKHNLKNILHEELDQEYTPDLQR